MITKGSRISRLIIKVGQTAIVAARLASPDRRANTSAVLPQSMAKQRQNDGRTEFERESDKI